MVESLNRNSSCIKDHICFNFDSQSSYEETNRGFWKEKLKTDKADKTKEHTFDLIDLGAYHWVWVCVYYLLACVCLNVKMSVCVCEREKKSLCFNCCLIFTSSNMF